MLPIEKQEAVRALLGSGLSDYEIARRSGISRRNVQNWRVNGFPKGRSVPKELPDQWTPPDPRLFSYLLGMYLGDGRISRHGPTGFGFSIYLDAKYPAINEECAVAMASVLGSKVARFTRRDSNCLRLTTYDRRWPQVFPQSGRGKKHERPIFLASWQQEIVDQFPREFLRGLIHSDGSRCFNTFTVQLKNGPREYSYPRYFFTNYSVDIQEIFTDTCDQLGIRWSRSNWRNISIAHRDSVATLDSFIGPKT